MNSTRELQNEILTLAKERQALIFAHYYQDYAIQEIAHVVGDSFALALKAAECPEPVLVLCGVRFMAETAKLLCPDKTVLLPHGGAGCPMADMVTPEIVRALRAEHPKAAVVCYVNSTAAVKAESDICCTSSSAEAVVRSLPGDEIIFIPDRNLGQYIASAMPDKRFYYMEGYCPIHQEATAEDVHAARAAHPTARFLAHPECRPEVTALADGAGSTAFILQQVEAARPGDEFIIGTETGIIERLRHTAPGRVCHPLREPFVCEDMKKVTLEHLRDCLQTLSPAIELPENAERARLTLERMMAANR